MQTKNKILKFLRGLDWRVLLSIPALAITLGVANNLRIPQDLRVNWSGKRAEAAIEADTTGPDAESAGPVESAALASPARKDAKPGEWTTNFAAATNAAEAAHLPVVVVAVTPGCPYCVRFHHAIDNEEVRSWQKKLGWYFVMSTSSDAKETIDFVKSTPVRNKTPPYAGVYWLRPDGTRALRNFPAKSGEMGIPMENSLAQEWMHAVEASAPGAPGSSFAPSQALGVQVSAKAESEKLGLGRVKMFPQTDKILPGQKVVLRAKPSAGSEFAGWRFPDGRIVDGEPQLVLDDQCLPGVYKAIFRRRKDSVKSASQNESEGVEE